MLIRSGLILAVGILLGRLLGFGRELGIAAKFGVTGMADAAILTLTLPDMLMNLLCAGVLSAVLVPEFVRLGERGSWRLHRDVSLFGFWAGCTLAAMLMLFARPLAAVLAPGASDIAKDAMAHGISWSAWLMPLIICASVTVVWLQALQRFGASAFSTVFFNGVLVAVIWWGLLGEDPLRALAIAMILAGVVRCLWLWSGVREFVSPLAPEGTDWAAVRRRYTGALLAGMAVFLFPVFGRAIASIAGDGGLAAYNYASKLIELPLAIAITMVSTVVFPRLVSLLQRNEDWQLLWLNSQRLIIGLSVSITLTALCFHRQLTDLAFGWGEMSVQGRDEVADLFAVGILSLGFQGIYTLNNLVLAACQEPKRMMWYSLAGLGVFVATGWLGFLLFAGTGLMLALCAAYVLMVLLQSVWLARRRAASLWQVFDARYGCMLLLMVCVSLPFFAISDLVGRWEALLVSGLQFSVLAVVAVVTQPLLGRYVGRRLGKDAA